jgi:hypothetical protein
MVFSRAGAGANAFRQASGRLARSRAARNWNMRGAVGSLAAARERMGHGCHDILQEPLQKALSAPKTTNND